MGKWNYRRRWAPKNYYRDQRIPSPPTYYDTEFKLRGASKNVNLPWEERFCISVGIPWQKVVNAKKYMYCHDNVVKWNDAASEETFCDAKKRFWAKINGIHSDDPQLDPDMYIDEIDWNTKIDPEVVKDLDQAYFNPDETEKVENFDATKKNDDSLVPGCILGLDDKNPSNSDNPWACNKNANINSKIYSFNCSNNSVNKNTSDPWERGIIQDDRETKDEGWGNRADESRKRNITWGGGGSSSWHKEITWGGGPRNSGNKEITWGGGANDSWHRNQHPVQILDDISRNTWGCGGRTAGLAKETGWRSNRSCAWNGWVDGEEFRHAAYVDPSWGTQPGGSSKSRQRGDYRDTPFGREKWHAQHDVPSGRGHQRHNGSGWVSNVSFRKREGTQQCTSSYKSARVQSDDYGSGNQWGRQRTENRVSFTRE